MRTTASFFVAERRLGPGLLGATILAANIGAGSTVGAAGLGYRDGVSAWWWVGSAGIGTLLLALWIGPRLWRIARDHDLRTVGDFLELRYSRGVRGVVAVLLWFGTLAILAGQLIAMAWVLEAVAGIPKTAGCLLGGLVMTLYFAAGGLLSSAWVNLAQLAVLLAGFALALAAVLDRGLAPLTALAPTPDYQSFWHGGASGWVYAPLLVPAFLVSPGLLQKVYGARDERTVRYGVAASALVLLAFAALPTLLGMAARLRHPELANPELALPTLLVQDLPPLLSFLALAAIFSAEVSSADAILFMLATSLSQDLYRRFLDPGASDRRILAVARGAAVGGGALGVALAVLLPSVIGALGIFYSLLGVSLLVPLVAGLYTRAPRTAEAFAAIAAGVATLLVLRYTPAINVLPGWPPTLAALLCSAGAFAAAAVLRRIRKW